MVNMDFSEIIGKILTNSASSREKEKFKAWLKESEDNQKGFHKIKELWDAPVVEEEIANTDELYKCLKFRMLRQKENKNRSFVLTRWKVAASLLAVLSIGLLTTLFFHNLPHSTALVLKTDKGQRSYAQLPDGSKVWLNAETELIVDDFSSGSRNVHLSGEAHFEVAHDTKHPFVVSFSELSVRVLGTTFNIRDYKNESVIKTSLQEGSIQISKTNSGNSKTILLKPGEMALYEKEEAAFVVHKEKNIAESSSWRKGVFVFKSIPFNDLMTEIERTYDVKINYNAKDFYNVHYTGTMDKLKIMQVLDFLSYTLPIKYNVNNNVIDIDKVLDKR